MRYRIELADDLMMVLDQDGYGHDALIVRPDDQEDAERKIDQWADEYRIDARSAKRELRHLLRQM